MSFISAGMYLLSVPLLLLIASYVPGSKACGGNVYVDGTATIQSPNYPSPYPNNKKCIWTIRAPPSFHILTRIDDFELEREPNCGFDSLEFRDGDSLISPLLGKFCREPAPLVERSSGNKLLVIFSTDGSNQRKGFRATLTKGAGTTCKLDEFQCFREDKCVSMKVICDGKNDCLHGNDERSCAQVCTATQPICWKEEDETLGSDPHYNGCNMADVHIPYGVYQNCREDANVKHDTNVTVFCKTGYSSASKSRSPMRCNDGNWTDIPQCVPSCTIPELPLHVSLLPQYNGTIYLQGEKVLVNCSEGYFLVDGIISSIISITCRGNNVWEPEKLLCSPKNHFKSIYKPQQEKIVETLVGETLDFPCVQQFVSDFMDYSENIHYLWLKDAVDVTTKQNISYSINSTDGSLNLFDVGHESLGSYTCLLKNGSQYHPTSVIYTVKLLTTCLPGPSNSTLIVEEYTSAIMFCPDTGLNNHEPPVWYNNYGKQVLNDDKYNLVMNVALLIPSVQYSDQGQYTCDIGPNTPFCNRRFTTNLKVIPTTESICGLSEKPGEFPWLVTLWWDDETAPFCYGALVNEHWVVTTALCLLGIHRKRDPGVVVMLGQQDLKISNRNYSYIPVEYARIHPQFNRRNSVADVGVVKLKRPTEYNTHIVPLCLSETDLHILSYINNTACDLKPPLTGNVSGLGSLDTDLQDGDVESMEIYSDSESCSADSGTCQKVPDGTFCAKGCSSESKHVGDIGSPFQVLHQGKMYLYGLFSFGERRSKISNFDYFTNVTSYYGWIVSKIRTKN